MHNITPKEAIINLNHIYGMVSPDIQRSLDVAIKALERPQGDCISREALKADLLSEVRDKYEFVCLSCVLQTIDDAQAVPQVTVFAENADEKAVADLKAELQSVIEPRPIGDWRDNLIEVFRQSAEVGGDTFHLFEIERIINGEPI